MNSTEHFNHKPLQEGNSYPFNYVKCVKLEDNNLYMILEDLYGIRHFVEYELYKNYCLSLNSVVNCQVVKINCTGRIYLEPEHPVYRKGEEYPFEFVSSIETEEGELISVYDCYGNLISLRSDTSVARVNNEHIIAKVDNITKGLPELTVVK